VARDGGMFYVGAGARPLLSVSCPLRTGHHEWLLTIGANKRAHSGDQLLVHVESRRNSGSTGVGALVGTHLHELHAQPVQRKQLRVPSLKLMVFVMRLRRGRWRSPEATSFVHIGWSGLGLGPDSNPANSRHAGSAPWVTFEGPGCIRKPARSQIVTDGLADDHGSWPAAGAHGSATAPLVWFWSGIDEVAHR